jgi:hypothetical protein
MNMYHDFNDSIFVVPVVGNVIVALYATVAHVVASQLIVQL